MALEGEDETSALSSKESIFVNPDPKLVILGSKFTEPEMGFLEQAEIRFEH